MTRPVPIIGIVAALCIVGWLGAATANRMYFAPASELRQEVADLETQTREVEGRLANRNKLDDAIQAFVDRTLGGDQETVDHQLRTRLNRIAEELELKGASVGTGSISTRRSPARSAFSRRGSWRELRDTTDFIELDGWISAEGSLQQVVQLVDRIDAEPWLKHIDQVKLDGKDNGRRFAVTVRLTTLFLPGREPGAAPATVYDPSRAEQFAALLTSNPFRVPQRRRPNAQATPQPPTPAPPAGFPWADWTLTGVAQSTAGPEIWLRNPKSGDTRRLAIGESIDAAELVAIGSTWAEFRLEGRRFRVLVGKNLNDRTPVSE
jgi:hypothetical protein